MLRRRRKAFPRPGDRICLTVPPASKSSRPEERSGTVLERSTGRSGALLVQWDAGSHGAGVSTETWLSDAVWHWEHGNLRVLDPKTERPRASQPARADVGPGEEDAWVADYPRAAAGPTHPGAQAAADEWEAAMRSDVDPADDDGWEAALAAALGLASPAPSNTEPSATPAAPEPPVRFAPSGQAASPDHRDDAPEGAGWTALSDDELVHAAALRPAAERSEAAGPAPAAEAASKPGSRAPWIGDDILPNARKGGKGGRFRR